MDPSQQLAALSVGFVAALCLAVALAAWRAVVRTGNPRIRLVVVAFLLLGAKNLVKSVRLAAGANESTALELAFSVVDLAAVGLIAWPLVMRRRPA